MEEFQLLDSRVTAVAETGQVPRVETTKCTAQVDDSGCLTLRFRMGSKTERVTKVNVEIGGSDLASLLSHLAEAAPQTAPVFAEAASLAASKLYERVQRTRDAAHRLDEHIGRIAQTARELATRTSDPVLALDIAQEGIESARKAFSEDINRLNGIE